MAETKKGNKTVVVKEYKRTENGHLETVKPHRRSTPNTSTGKAKKK